MVPTRKSARKVVVVAADSAAAASLPAAAEEAEVAVLEVTMAVGATAAPAALEDQSPPPLKG